eukprot:3145618-Prymnesium_polylepis.1
MARISRESGLSHESIDGMVAVAAGAVKVQLFRAQRRQGEVGRDARDRLGNRCLPLPEDVTPSSLWGGC